MNGAIEPIVRLAQPGWVLVVEDGQGASREFFAGRVGWKQPTSSQVIETLGGVGNGLLVLGRGMWEREGLERCRRRISEATLGLPQLRALCTRPQLMHAGLQDAE